MERLDIISEVSTELNLNRQKVEKTVELMDEDNTIPFIARYRKEITGGLDEVDIRNIKERVDYLRNLQERKDEVISLIDKLGKLTPDLEENINRATKLQQVEDLYRPFRPKKRTKATVAREKGLEPLADIIFSCDDKGIPIEDYAIKYVDPEKGVNSIEDALHGACDIIAEDISDDATVRDMVRNYISDDGFLKVRYIPENEDETTPRKTEYMMYYSYEQRLSKIPSHRILAINRGEREKVLKVIITAPHDGVITKIKKDKIHNKKSGFVSLVAEAIEDSYNRLIFPSIEREIRSELSNRAQSHAILIFATNLKNLLLQPPIRGKIVMGIDPAYRTGCKLAIVNSSGDVLDTSTIYPHKPQSQVKQSKDTLLSMIHKTNVQVIAIGNGTASRETRELVIELITKNKLKVGYAIVNEAGASVYSASDLARQELPDLDVSMRGAVSIARRLLDPLSELVKIDPKSIGVGQYQHDVSQKKLSKSLVSVVESCVNYVGVDLNSASPALLKYVAGLSYSIALKIVDYRRENDIIYSRKDIKNVHGVGDKTFIQCAGFLKIPESDNPLDNTWVHPESYEQVENLFNSLGFDINDLKNSDTRRDIISRLSNMSIDEMSSITGLGIPTMKDILETLKKPGRDPRDDMPQPDLKEDVLAFEDLKLDMVLEGTVRNVVDFGAFIDIGLKRDGLVHISEMSDDYVSHPTEVVSVGDIVKVKVINLDSDRERVSLSMKAGGEISTK